MANRTQSTARSFAVDHTVSEQEKNEAKSLLQRLLGGKAAVSVLGPGAQSLAAKYFTG
jgi:hypothetical protein